MRFATKEKVQALITQKKGMLIDMRSPIHFRDDPIVGAVNLPLRAMVNNLMTIKDKKKPIVLFGLTSSDPDLKSGVTYAENLSFEEVYITDLRQLKDTTEKVKK